VNYRANKRPSEGRRFGSRSVSRGTSTCFCKRKSGTQRLGKSIIPFPFVGQGRRSSKHTRRPLADPTGRNERAVAWALPNERDQAYFVRFVAAVAWCTLHRPPLRGWHWRRTAAKLQRTAVNPPPAWQFAHIPLWVWRQGLFVARIGPLQSAFPFDWSRTIANCDAMADIPLQVVSDNFALERRITPSWSINVLKTKLEHITGVPPSSQKLYLKLSGQPAIPIEAADEDRTQLASFPLIAYAELQVSKRCKLWANEVSHIFSG